jgi:hypothetical protein
MSNRISTSPKTSPRSRPAGISPNSNNVNPNANNEKPKPTTYARSRTDGVFDPQVKGGFNKLVDNQSSSIVDGPYGKYSKADLDRQQELVNQLTEVNPETNEMQSKPGGYTYVPGQKIVGLTDGRMPKETQIGRAKDKRFQGWKMHVGADPNQVGELAKTVLPVLQDHKVNYKLVDKVSTYASDDNPKQIGKFITVYTKDKDQVKELAMELDPVLRQSELTLGQKNQGELYLGNSGLLSTRYGSFTHKNLIDPQGKSQPDDRNSIAPGWRSEELQEIKAFGAAMAALQDRQPGDRRAVRISID